MTDLVAIAGEEPSVQNHLHRIITSQPWRKVYLITQIQQTLPPSRPPLPSHVEIVSADFNQPIQAVISSLVSHLKPRISGTEVGLNLIAGSGKQHMAVLSAVLQCGVGFRLIALTQEGVVEV